MYALNPTHSPEKLEFWVWADPLRSGAGHARSALKTSAERPPGVSDGIEVHNGRQVTRRATIKGSWGNAQRKYPSTDDQCKKRRSDGRVASDKDRYAAMVNDEEG